MGAVFLVLWAASLLAAFVLRTDWLVDRERRVPAALLHGVFAALASYLLLGAFHWRILLAVLAAHAMSASWKEGESLAPFLAGQSARAALALGLAWRFPEAASGGWWAEAAAGTEFSKWYLASVSCATGVILCVPVGGALIARAIAPLAGEVRGSDIAGLNQGGRYIGWLERILVLLLVLMDQPNGIGFLIAAKSILRFGEIKDASQRKVAEYIIIGTFLSFGWALLVSAVTHNAIRYWLR